MKIEVSQDEADYILMLIEKDLFKILKEKQKEKKRNE